MLRKLLKHEFKFYIKFVSLSYAILAAALLLARLCAELLSAVSKHYGENTVFDLAVFPSAIIFIAAGITVLGVLVLPVVLGAVRFYRNLIKDEGYLSFTLPVSASSHVFCKVFTPLVFTVLSAIVTALLTGAAIFVFKQSMFADFCEALNELTRYGDWKYFVVSTVVTALLSVASLTTLIAFSFSIGQLFRKQKLLGAIGCYIGTNMVYNMVSSVVTAAVMVVSAGQGAFEENLSFMNFSLPYFITSAVLSLAFVVAAYLISCYVLKNKLNLE